MVPSASFKTWETIRFSLNLTNVTIEGFENHSPWLHPPSSLWEDFARNVSTDILFNAVQYASVNIINSRFIGGYGNAILVQSSPFSQFAMTTTTFTNYTHQVLSFTDDLEGTTIILRDTNLTNDSINAGSTEAPGIAAAVLMVYPSNPTIANTIVEIDHCLIQDNSDNVGNLQIILLHILVNNASIKNSSFIRNNGTAIALDESKIHFSGEIVFDGNIAFQGGALSLTSAQIYLADNTTINFTNNYATHFGGAIYVNDPLFYLQNGESTQAQCFYQPINSEFTGILVNFDTNSAQFGGDDIYGTTINNYCKTANNYNSFKLKKWHEIFNQVSHNMESSLSSVSSRALRVCLCDDQGQPQCADEDWILKANDTVYPGQEFNISAVIVGAEFGTTVGQVYAKILSGTRNSNHIEPKIQTIDSRNACTKLTYSVRSNTTREMIYLAAADIHWEHHEDIELHIRKAIGMYSGSNPHVIPFSLLTTPVTIEIGLKKCPLGFNLTHNPPYCDCFFNLKLKCYFDNGTGYVSRNESKWIGKKDSDEDHTYFSDSCPYDYCKPESVSIQVGSTDSDQCDNSRSGILCGKCKEGYSVAIGSSRCLPNDNTSNFSLFLLIFFAAAGPLLYILIAFFGLTITKGAINGLLFYANIVWINEKIIFSGLGANVLYAKPFIAWLNLDFGIESFFFKELDTFMKSILQHIFPVYIWIIAGTVVAVYKRSNVQKLSELFKKLANFIENPVDILATFILLSYTKLIHITSDAFQCTTLTRYPDKTKIYHTWTLDGSVDFLKGKHIVLFVFALITLIVTLAYTLYILVNGLKIHLCECSRDEVQDGDDNQQEENNEHDQERQGDNEDERDRHCHLHTCHSVRRKATQLLSYVEMPLPICNAHFAPLVGKHRYWIGLMLLVRIILLVTFVSTAIHNRFLNLLLVLITAIVLLMYISWYHIYIDKNIQLLQGISLCNLAFISGGVLYAELIDNSIWKSAIIWISTGVAFLQLIAIICYHFTKCCSTEKKRARPNVQANPNDQAQMPHDNQIKLQGQHQTDGYIHKEESLLDYESENDDNRPLLPQQTLQRSILRCCT